MYCVCAAELSPVGLRCVRVCAADLPPLRLGCAVCARARVRQNFLLCVFDAQYERDLQLSNGSQTHLGQLDDMMNAVG